MRLHGIPFEAIDWSTVPASEHPGVIGVALWRTRQFGEVRVRMVEYSPATSPTTVREGPHRAVSRGEIHTELGTPDIVLKPGMTTGRRRWEPHRSRTANGARLFIVD